MSRSSLHAAVAFALAIAAGVAHADDITEVVLGSDVRFLPLNPARGDAAPKAGALWGDIRKNVPTGALIKFAGGFSSPPHIHNITYRGVVISGAVHNDDPTAGNLWMGSGSFWTQPAGEVHITAAGHGNKATAFLEILEGPYLVQPPGEAFDSGERPVNLNASNIVWLEPSDITWVSTQAPLAALARSTMAFLWGSTQEGRKNGSFLKIPAGSSGELRGNGAWLRAVLIAGRLTYQQSKEPLVQKLQPGSYFGSQEKGAHDIACVAEDACLIYVSTQGKYQFAEA